MKHHFFILAFLSLLYSCISETDECTPARLKMKNFNENAAKWELDTLHVTNQFSESISLNSGRLEIVKLSDLSAKVVIKDDLNEYVAVVKFNLSCIEKYPYQSGFSESEVVINGVLNTGKGNLSYSNHNQKSATIYQSPFSYADSIKPEVRTFFLKLKR